MDTMNDSYMASLKAGMASLLEEEGLFDVEIVINKRIFHCHRAVLAALSPYFKVMFTGGMREMNQKRIVIHDLDELAFDTFRHYIYTGKLECPETNIIEILKVAAIFQVDCLQEECEKILISNVCFDNCLGMNRLSTIYSCPKLQQRAWFVIVDNFQNLWKKEEFLELDFQEMVKLVGDDKLVATDEEQIVEAVLRWVEYDESKRRPCLYQIFGQIRLVHLSTEYLATRLCTEPLLMESVECRKLVQETQNYHMLPGRKLDWSTNRTRFRVDDEIEEVVLLVTENDRERGNMNEGGFSLWAFSEEQSRWFTLANVPYEHSPGPNFTVCMYGFDLYLAGGLKRPKAMLKYEIERNEWIVCNGQLKKGRYRHCMVAIGKSLFVVGGNQLKHPNYNATIGTVEEYYLPLQKWKTVGEIGIPVHSASAAASGECILMIGGVDQHGTTLTTVQSYHTRTKEIIEIKNTERIPRDHLLCTKIDDSMYLTGKKDGKNVMVKLDSSLKFEDIIFKIPTEGRILGVVHSYGSMLFVMEHENGKGQLGAIIKVDMRSSSMETVQMKEILCRMPIHACRKSFVDRNNLYHTYFQ